MDSLKHREIPGRATLVAGQENLPAIHIETEWSTAEIYPHGAHVTRFQKKGEAPLLFMSGSSEYKPGKPIRGGVPLIFPWFGARDGLPAHGTARITTWDLMETRELPDGSIRLLFRLPSQDGIEADFIVTVGRTLAMEFAVTNAGTADLTFENCLHTYFHIGDIRQISISGLQGARYRDQLLAAEFTEAGESIRFSGEVDRVYQNTAATAVIHDPELCRKLIVRKSGSQSTVVWNPWIEKSKRMPDFGDDEWPNMVCVESGNVREHAITLAPGARSTFRVELDSEPLG